MLDFLPGLTTMRTTTQLKLISSTAPYLLRRVFLSFLRYNFALKLTLLESKWWPLPPFNRHISLS